VLAYRQRAFPNRPRAYALVRIHPMTIWFAHCFVPGPGYGLVYSVLSSRARACRRDHQAPSAPLPDVGVTFVRETFPPPAETLLSGPRSYEHMCQSRVALLCFGSSPRSRSLCRLLLAPAAIGIFSTLFCESFLGCLVPCPGGPIGCMRLLLPRCHRPSPGKVGSASRCFPRTQLFVGVISRLQTFRYVQAPKFVRLPGCTHRYGYAVGRPRLLRPGRTCFVASARTGYASRPYTGN
jgi:hypothetical protein